MNYIIDPLLENILFSVEKKQKGLLVIDDALERATDYPTPYLSFHFAKYRIENDWRIHELVFEYVFEPPTDAEYINASVAQRNLMKSHYTNVKINELKAIVFQLVAPNNPYADRYADMIKGVESVGTRFKIASGISGTIGINRYGTDENQNWSITAMFEIQSVDKKYSCEKPIPTAAELLIDDAWEVISDDENNVNEVLS